jgi:predicted methyltransferase
LREVIRKGDTVIDATAGNGHDTVFLAECVGASGKVLAFDVQAAAILASSKRVAEQGHEKVVHFHPCSHDRMGEFAAPCTISAIMFNLGYLPGEDHQITTRTCETIRALESAETLLENGGCVSIVCYPGHEAGAEEAQAVEGWLSTKTKDGWRVANYSILGTKRPAPFLLLARKE